MKYTKPVYVNPQELKELEKQISKKETFNCENDATNTYSVSFSNGLVAKIVLYRDNPPYVRKMLLKPVAESDENDLTVLEDSFTEIKELKGEYIFYYGEDVYVVQIRKNNFLNRLSASVNEKLLNDGANAQKRTWGNDSVIYTSKKRKQK